jgi:hypothetical protein
MSFYLLKSSVDRIEVGDVILNLDRIESIMCGKIKKKVDGVEIDAWVVKVYMDSKDYNNGVFATEKEALAVIHDLISHQSPEQAKKILSEYKVSENKRGDERKELFEKFIASI